MAFFPFVLVLALLALIVKPIITYIYDPLSLRKYPNQNILSPFTELAYVWSRRNSFRTKALYIQHEKYPIIRVGPRTLSFGSVAAIQDIYGHSSPCLKAETYQATLSPGAHTHILNAIDREDHATKRRMLSNAFATRNLESWEEKIVDKVKCLVRQLDRMCIPSPNGSVHGDGEFNVDWRKWSNLFTIDAIAEIALSEKTHVLEARNDTIMVSNQGGKTRTLSFLESMHGGARIASWFFGAPGWFTFFKRATSLISPHLRRKWEQGEDFGAIVRHLVDRRLSRLDNPDDFIACLLADKSGKPRNLDRGEIETEANMLLDAGSETTAIALTHLLYYLVRNPDSLSQLRVEVTSILQESEIIAPYAKVKNLPYLKACINESLRLSPPLPRGLERATPPDGIVIAGTRIAGNVGVSVPAYIAHRDATIFPNPEQFAPERWLQVKPAELAAMGAAFIPFSTGSRGCIGRNLTMMEQQILVATLVHRYNFVLPDGFELEYEEAFNLWPGRMPMRVWRRG
ncbi:hypothetical protein BDW74DRAFT_186034 [Aspergillus multicolor]|uniref:cytochrome P450 n=1 Tax=Aspergillus multicolor TaxID=41759 RepID=UPI003CCDE291